MGPETPRSPSGHYLLICRGRAISAKCSGAPRAESVNKLPPFNVVAIGGQRTPNPTFARYHPTASSLSLQLA
jgi:hypothetical protein